MYPANLKRLSRRVSSESHQNPVIIWRDWWDSKETDATPPIPSLFGGIGGIATVLQSVQVILLNDTAVVGHHQSPQRARRLLALSDLGERHSLIGQTSL